MVKKLSKSGVSGGYFLGVCGSLTQLLLKKEKTRAGPDYEEKGEEEGGGRRGRKGKEERKRIERKPSSFTAAVKDKWVIFRI